MRLILQGKFRKGWVSISILSADVWSWNPGSGKTFSIIEPFDPSAIALAQYRCIHDYKSRHLPMETFYHYKLNEKSKSS